jgi:hypothetical protein
MTYDAELSEHIRVNFDELSMRLGIKMRNASFNQMCDAAKILCSPDDSLFDFIKEIDKQLAALRKNYAW